MTKKKKRGRNQSAYNDIKRLIQEILNDPKYRRVSHKQLIKQLGVKDKKTKNTIKAILNELTKNKPKGGSGDSNSPSGGEIIGKVDFVNPRLAYIISDQTEEDVIVKADNLKYALDDDTVRVQLFSGRRKSSRQEGKVVEIINRFRKEFSATKKPDIQPYRRIEIMGHEVLIGKNAIKNELLTFKTARKDDLFLHAKDVAGSHVIIRKKSSQNFPAPVIEQAASIAAFYSKNKNESLCSVLYTPRKFVRKAKGAPAGTVIVEKEKVILVKPMDIKEF